MVEFRLEGWFDPHWLDKSLLIFNENVNSHCWLLLERLYGRAKIGKRDHRKESSIFRFSLIFYYVLTDLQFALKFVCPFVIGEGAFLGDEVENLIVVIIVVINVTPNQLSTSYHAFHIRSALNQKIPLVLYPVHLFPLKCSPSPRLVKGISSIKN